jgi:hypothetical protein
MRLSLVLVCCGVLLAGTACKKTSGTGAAKEDMQLAPREADIVFMANVTRMRNTQMFRKLLDVRDSDPSSKKDFDEFVQKCGLDPFKQIDSVFVAFPQGGGTTKEFAAVLRGTFDEQKLVACAKDQAKKDGTELTSSDYNGKKLYTDSKQQQAFATFLDAKTVAIGGKEWIKKVVDAAARKEPGLSAKDNEVLMGLVKRAKTSDAIWGAGLVPQSTRDALKADPHLSAAGSIKDMFGSVDFASGVAADINVDTGGENDAKELAAKATAQLMETKKSPQLMMMGLGSFLDGVKIDSKGATFHVAMAFNQQQVDDLITRIKGLLKSFGGQLGGGGAGGAVPPLPTQPTP